MNPLEETQEITVNDVLGFAEECSAPEVADEGIEEFLDLEYIMCERCSSRSMSNSNGCSERLN